MSVGGDRLAVSTRGVHPRNVRRAGHGPALLGKCWITNCDKAQCCTRCHEQTSVGIVGNRTHAHGMAATKRQPHSWGLGVNRPEPILKLLDVADPDVCLLASQYSLIDHKNALQHVFPAEDRCINCGDRNWPQRAHSIAAYNNQVQPARYVNIR